MFPAPGQKLLFARAGAGRHDHEGFPHQFLAGFWDWCHARVGDRRTRGLMSSRIQLISASSS